MYIKYIQQEFYIDELDLSFCSEFFSTLAVEKIYTDV